MKSDTDKAQERDEALLAVSPIDGRYRVRTRALIPYFSEYALIRYRMRVEIEWLLALADNPAIDAMPALDAAERQRLLALHENFALARGRSHPPHETPGHYRAANAARARASSRRRR